MYSQLELDAEQSRSLASIWRTDWWWSTVRGRSRGWQVGMGGLGTMGSCKSSPLVHKTQENGMQLKSLAIIFLEPLKEPWRHGCNWIRVCVEAQSPRADVLELLPSSLVEQQGWWGEALMLGRGSTEGLPSATSQQVSCSITMYSCSMYSWSHQLVPEQTLRWHRAGGHGELGLEQSVQVLQWCFGHRAGFSGMGWGGLPG